MERLDVDGPGLPDIPVPGWCIDRVLDDGACGARKLPGNADRKSVRACGQDLPAGNGSELLPVYALDPLAAVRRAVENCSVLPVRRVDRDCDETCALARADYCGAAGGLLDSAAMGAGAGCRHTRTRRTVHGQK